MTEYLQFETGSCLSETINKTGGKLYKIKYIYSIPKKEKKKATHSAWHIGWACSSGKVNSGHYR